MSRQFIAPTCDIVARNKIKALEAKVGGGSSGGGIPTAIIKQDGYDNALMGVAVAGGESVDVPTFTCTNMTYDEAKNIILSGQPLSAVVMTLFKPNDEYIEFSSEYLTSVRLGMESNGDQYIQIWDYKYPRFFWTSEGIIVDEG